MIDVSNLPSCVKTYLRAVNSRQPDAFLSAFSPEAVVQDIGREIRGNAAIKHWADNEIFAVSVTLELLSFTTRQDFLVLTVKVDGTFDKSGLPDPLVMTHALTVADEKITKLVCALG